ncbi:MAG TPA: hypothetical protein VET65_01160 [Candidatus Limnocylindrales bacterium]|nr:hypothetical protein [Candidatus Limnocylindrales bacterium]
MGGSVRRRRRDLRPLLIHAAGWVLGVLLLGWLLLAAFFGLVST